MSQDPIVAAIDARIKAMQELRARCVELLGPIGTNGASADVERETKGGRRGTKRAKGATARPTEAPTEIQAEILAALQAVGEPVSPGQLAKTLKIEINRMRYHLKPLIASGQVEATGTTANRLLSAA